MSGVDDQDQLFLDCLITLVLDIVDRAQVVKDLSDDPEVLIPTLEIEGRALVMQKIIKEYRPRLLRLKHAAQAKTND
jgi:hypothetical protein